MVFFGLLGDVMYRGLGEGEIPEKWNPAKDRLIGVPTCKWTQGAWEAEPWWDGAKSLPKPDNSALKVLFINCLDTRNMVASLHEFLVLWSKTIPGVWSQGVGSLWHFIIFYNILFFFFVKP